IGTVSDGKNKSETGGKENDRKKEGVDEVDRGKDISYESDTSSKKKDSTEDVVNKDVKEAEEVGKDEKDKKTEASDSTDFEATDKKLADKIKKIDDEIDDIWADFNKLGISLTPEQQAENMAKAVRLMSLYAQKGVYKLAQIINDAIKHFGRAKTEEFLPFLKKAYLASQSEVEDDIIDKFDDVKSVRNFKILDDVSGIDTNRENNNVKIQEDESKEVNNKGHGASGSFMDRTREIVEQGSLFGDDEVGGIIRSGEGKRGEVSQGRGGDERSVPSGRSRGDSKEGTLSGTVRLTNNVPIPGTIEPQQSPKKNYEPKSIDAPRTFNIKSHFEDNNTAIRTLLSIIKDGDRLATEAEKEILAKYVGWGGIKAVNRIEGQAWSNADMPYKELFGELVELTKDFEAIGYSRLLNDISKSTLNAHYTGTDVIEGIYSALEHLGFKGGNILEPSAGIGNFIGFAPKNIMNNSSVTAIEIDRLTGKILEKLYPSASTFIKGYEEVSMPLNGFDLIVSNIPFGNYGVATSRNDSPIVKKASKKIHNYFFAKALEQVKDGGIIAFVTSTGVMDSKGNEFLRQYISENAWFIGAIRLPNKTFKGLAGTSVTTDIIFLKKTASPISNTDFIGTSDVEINGEVLSINNYFKENPNHVIGEYTIGRLYGGKQIAVEYKGENSIYDEISSIVKKGFPKNIVSATQSIPQSHAHATVTNIEPNTIIYDKEGSYFITDAGIKRKIANKHQAKVPSFIRLRDILKEQYRLEASPNVKDEEIEANRALLNKEYDNYVSNFGALNTQDNKPFVMSDVFGYNLLGSELKDKDSNRYHKADIFKKRVINKNNRVDIADNLGDAISISINETGAIDIKRLASLLNVKEETLVEDYYGELFYDSDGTVVDREAYLSGNVKKKYKEAVSLSESNPIYNKNVEALEKVIPKDIPIELIDINIGARFVPIEYYRDFATFIFNTQVEASYNRILDQYKFKGGNSANVNLLYGTSRIDGYKLLEHALHGSRPTIYDKIDESTTIVNQEETQLAIEKLEEIERVFRNWIVSDGNRASVLKRIYNDAFNTTIKREFSPKGFSINGSNSAITLADHQVSAIKMLVTNRGGIIDHIVGAGKTFLMISAAMKMKQLGIANKPTIIGLKSTIQDLVSDAKKLFPTASILSPSENDFSAQNRKSFLAKIQNNDWDIIIMSHEQFGYIPQDNEFQQNIIQQEIEEIEQALLQSAGDTGPSKQQLSGLIKRKENLTKKLSELSSRDIDKEVINFRNIGIDHLFVDESQYFKNLQYTTRINRVSGLGNPIGSKRSYNMLTAIRTLQAKNGGDKGVTFLSGTPISNSLVEMYLLLKYLRPTKLEELGYRTFDSWVKQFATQSSQMEFTVSGSVKLKNRFREFVNIPELSILYNEIADIRNDNNLKLPKPVIRGGSPQLIAVKQSDEQLEWTDRLIEFSNQKHGDRDGSLIGKPNMSESQQSAAMLLVTNISNKLSVDLRLVDKNSPFNPDGKLAAAANVIKEEYDKSSGIKGTQLIFSDIGTPKSGRVMDDLQSFLEDQLNVSNDDINLIFGEANDEGKRPSRSISKIKENIKEILEYTDSQIDQIIQDSKGSKDDFNAYSELRRLLIQHGIPESEIAFIHDYKTKKQREKLFKAVNEGSIRVVIGSTQKLGTGVNIQQRIVALHHIDAKWNPADMEQRNGRGIRQKNMNKEVAVYNYGTERTLDAYKYQLISTKQKFINQVKSGALSEDRYALEEDGEDLAASSITAILSGNPLLFEKAKTDSEVEKLRRSQRAFIAQQSNIDSEIEALEHSIPNQQKFIEKRVKDIDTTKANTMTNKDGELKPTWVIDGKRVDDNDTRVSLVKAKTDTVRNAEPGTTVLIGKVGGLQYIAQKVHNENAGLFTSDIQYKLVGEMEYKSNTLPFNAIEKLPADLEKAKTFLEKSKKDLESLKEKENRVWDKQNELDQKIIKQKQINDSLANQNEESSLSQDKKNVSRGEVGLGFKEILQRT
ncbi:MAG TPA: helicase-related protein, partial [Saprospiraceae bacterium]|nr:helicase-related protein [Saprospiraceae bacterium]